MCPCYSTLVLLAILGILFYKFLVWNFGYWRKLGIVEAKSYPVAGSFPSQFTQKRHVIYDIDDIYRRYKTSENFVGVINGRTPQLLVLSPDYAHKIFVNDFKSFHDNEFANFVDQKSDIIFANNPFVLKGEEWKSRRAEITPGLTSNRVESVYPVTLKVCKNFADYIMTQSKMAPKNGIEAKQLCLRYTTEVVSDCVLGVKADSFSENPTPIYIMTQKLFQQSYFFIFYAVIAELFPSIRNIYKAPFFPKDAQTFFSGLMKKAIELRRNTKEADRIDFLNYILQLQDKKNLNNIEVTSHTMTFLTDGFETTAGTLSHTLLLLARYPKVQEKLRSELGTNQLSFDALNDLPYLDACVHESLRVFSPLLFARKLCTETYELTNKNGTTVKLNPEDVVLVPIHSIHHDPEIYENPEEFIPERFLEENGSVKTRRDKGEYFGFGDGPRVCLGMRFALVQLKAALVEIIRTFNIRVDPKTRTDNQLDDTYFMALLKGGLWLHFEERK